MQTLTMGELTFDIDSPDMVNSPPHYNKSGVECIDAIRAATDDGYKYYLQGTVMKYLWRYEYKNKPLEDLKKAKWYLNKLIKQTKKSKEAVTVSSFT